MYVTGAVLLGYVVGKVSYQGKCREKILQLENSQLADSIRHRRRGGAPWSDAYVIMLHCLMYCIVILLLLLLFLLLL